MARKLTRKEMREQLYRMLFQLEFHKDAELDEQLELADKFHGVAAHVEELDSMINDKSTGWKVGRLPKADLTVLRLAVYEIMFDENVPDNVAVNEAVELAKQYCGDSSPRYINGVLAAVVRERSNTDAETQ